MAQRLHNNLYIFKHSVSVYLSVKCTNVHISVKKRGILTCESSGAKHMITGDINKQNQTRPSTPTCSVWRCYRHPKRKKEAWCLMFVPFISHASFILSEWEMYICRDSVTITQTSQHVTADTSYTPPPVDKSFKCRFTAASTAHNTDEYKSIWSEYVFIKC